MSIYYNIWKKCFSDNRLWWTSDRLQKPNRSVQPSPRSEYNQWLAKQQLLKKGRCTELSVKVWVQKWM